MRDKIWRKHEFSFYFEPNKNASWQSAQAECITIGGRLATIRNQQALDFVNSMRTVPHANYWIGASDLETEGIFKYVTGEIVAFFNFPDTEPNGETQENCMQIFGIHKDVTERDKMNDNKCDEEHRFICERN
ncbi:hypothetical protein DPMN_008270 [Dreissena polymorpha]|uniref:C-type lectin domain-containing protein n=1 Tax=Dreissena polymorpha TaxID=45954 RepID=A0A9D4MYG6_DREPO|nr:hypothetical protein DPMN_008270 [Dreissena polymorpha]